MENAHDEKETLLPAVLIPILVSNVIPNDLFVKSYHTREMPAGTETARQCVPRTLG